MSAPADLRYLQSHEWHRREGDTVTVGITNFAADELTDITFVGLPKVGTKLTANARFGDIESVKAASELYCGVAGTITEVNGELANDPGIVNRDPYGQGWMIKVKMDDPSQLDKLLSAEDYLKKSGH